MPRLRTAMTATMTEIAAVMAKDNTTYIEYVSNRTDVNQSNGLTPIPFISASTTCSAGISHWTPPLQKLIFRAKYYRQGYEQDWLHVVSGWVTIKKGLFDYRLWWAWCRSSLLTNLQPYPCFTPCPHTSMLTTLKATGLHVTLHHLLRSTFTLYDSNWFRSHLL